MAADVDSGRLASEQVEAQLDREIELVRGAILMVASGGSRRLTVSGIRFGEAVIRICRPLATSADVTIEPLWRAEETGCDVVVRTQTDV